MEQGQTGDLYGVVSERRSSEIDHKSALGLKERIFEAGGDMKGSEISMISNR